MIRAKLIDLSSYSYSLLTEVSVPPPASSQQHDPLPPHHMNLEASPSRPPGPIPLLPWLFMYIFSAISPADVTADSLLELDETRPWDDCWSKSCLDRDVSQAGGGGFALVAAPSWEVACFHEPSPSTRPTQGLKEEEKKSSSPCWPPTWRARRTAPGRRRRRRPRTSSAPAWPPPSPCCCRWPRTRRRRRTRRTSCGAAQRLFLRWREGGSVSVREMW